MIEIEVPRDVGKYEAKLVGAFTTRQIACFVAACAINIPLFLILREIVPQDVATIVILLIALPFVLVGWIKPYGMKFEQFAKTAFISNVLAPKRRKYITLNNYDFLENEDFSYEKALGSMKLLTEKEMKKESAKKIKTKIKYMV